MGYPDGLLARDEKLLLHRHQHWKELIGPTAWGVVFTGAAIALFVWAIPAASGVGHTVAWVATVVVWLGLFIWLTFIPYLSWQTTHFVVTDRRVLYRTGILTRSGIDIPLARINTVQFRHGVIDRLFRTGTLIVESASDDPLEFKDIPQVEKVHAMLYNELHEELQDHDDPR